MKAMFWAVSRKVIAKSLSFVVLALLLPVSFPVVTARADIITFSDLTIAGGIQVRDNAGHSSQYNKNDAWSSSSPPDPIAGFTWSFTPSILSAYAATAFQSSQASYGGSSFSVAGSGSVSTDNSAGAASSGFDLSFTPSVNTSFHLSGSLSGDIYQAGYYLSGQVGFIGFPNGLPWFSVLPNANSQGAIWEPVTFDVSGTFYAGVYYHFFISAEAGPETHQANWVFNLSMPTASPVPEPATMLLLGSGLIGLAGARRRFKK